MSSAEDQALPCPFCGRAPKESRRASDCTGTGEWHVISCYCNGYVSCAWKGAGTREEVLALWNTRATAANTEER